MSNTATSVADAATPATPPTGSGPNMFGVITSTGSDFFDDVPVGEWCRVDYTVANDGTEAVSLLAGDIKLISGDFAYDAVFVDVPVGERPRSVTVR